MSTPQPLPSLPPSPGEGHEDEPTTPKIRLDKGKGKQVELEDVSDEDGDESDDNSYPPGHDEYAETKRVEETLKRWEMAERQRRKSVRESVNGVPQSPSVMGNVSRSASLLWRNNNSGPARPSIADHKALPSSDSVDALPLNDIPPSSSPPPPPAQDPFTNPSEDNVSPFSDSHQAVSVMSPSVDSATTQANSSGPPDRPTLKAKPSSFVNSSGTPKIPPPKPLGLPPPKAPPPPIDLPPSPTTQPTVTPRQDHDDDDGRVTRWWHEWLCGCGEGPDRGGDNQAGRTNPYE